MALKTFCFETKLKVFPQISLIFPMAINDRFLKNSNYPQVSNAGLWKIAWLCVKNLHLRHFYKKKISFTVIAVHQYLSVWDKLQSNIIKPIFLYPSFLLFAGGHREHSIVWPLLQNLYFQYLIASKLPTHSPC